MLAGGLVLCGDVEDSVGVHFEGDHDLWDASGEFGYSSELEECEGSVGAGEFALAFEDADGDGGLLILWG